MISHIDHIVLTVADIERAIAFYQRVLHMQPLTFGAGRRALTFGRQKINLQTPGQELRNHACRGSGDLCLITAWPPDRLLAHLAAEGVPVLEGPVTRAGAQGPICSIYINDPDGNLIEISSYPATARPAACAP